MLGLRIHFQLDRGFGHRPLASDCFDIYAIMQPLELLCVRSGFFSNEQIKRRLGRFELVAFVFQILNPFQDSSHQSIVVIDLVFGRLGDDVRASRKFTHQNASLISNGFGGNVLVAGGKAIDGMNVHPTLMSERTGTNERLSVSEVHVGDFVDIPRQLSQTRQSAWLQDVVPFL